MSENTTNNKAKGGDKSSLPIGIRQSLAWHSRTSMCL